MSPELSTKAGFYMVGLGRCSPSVSPCSSRLFGGRLLHGLGDFSFFGALNGFSLVLFFLVAFAVVA